VEGRSGCQQYKSLGQAGNPARDWAKTIVQCLLTCKLKTFARFARRVTSRVPLAPLSPCAGYRAETTTVTLIVLLARSLAPIESPKLLGGLFRQ
jgi:hypothetical protein